MKPGGDGGKGQCCEGKQWAAVADKAAKKPDWMDRTLGGLFLVGIAVNKLWTLKKNP